MRWFFVYLTVASAVFFIGGIILGFAVIPH